MYLEYRKISLVRSEYWRSCHYDRQTLDILRYSTYYIYVCL